MSSDQRPQVKSKNFEHPDAVRQLGRGSGAYVDLGTGVAIGRAVLEPGWRWSIDLKPVVGTPSCEVHHLQLILGGRLAVRMDGGEEHVFGPSEVIDIPPGHDTWVVGQERVVLVDMAGHSPDFALPAPRTRTVLTMLMTDIVNSTQMAARIGDAAWKQRLGDHDRIVRQQLERFHGREINTTGDGFLAAFTSAEAALRAALSITEAVRAAGVEIRAGVHTGEVESLDSGDLRGIAVHATARIMAAAPTGTVYTSGLTRTLAGSGRLRFTSAGTHPLKGFEDSLELFLVEEAA